ncbi:hypothetical protein LS482_08570 [Sinomicrobium kalidii]|uniref:hypothetical protein n=1 Tax=Sinomicrobium kalidii TaxID=2900738 RepID=UPI001E436AF0|nr:hypothetical protein [Sinomicrobium kalidii]UGU17920.1 hypothetical protein LS482_08570 [Sinomicrobium kalidii]
MQDNFGSVAKFISQGVIQEYTHSVTSEITMVTGQYYDSNGKEVSGIEEANSYKVTTNTESTTVKVNMYGTLPESATRTTSKTSTTYKVKGDSKIDDHGEKQLTDPVKTTSEPTIETINFENVGSSLQKYAIEQQRKTLLNQLK